MLMKSMMAFAMAMQSTPATSEPRAPQQPTVEQLNTYLDKLEDRRYCREVFGEEASQDMTDCQIKPLERGYKSVYMPFSNATMHGGMQAIVKPDGTLQDAKSWAVPSSAPFVEAPKSNAPQ